MVRKILLCLLTCQMSLNAVSMLEISISVVHSINRRPMPRNSPFFVCIKYELTKPIMVFAASGCDDNESLNHSSIYIEYPNPRAIAKTTAIIGTNASNVEYVRLLAVHIMRFWFISCHKARKNVNIVFLMSFRLICFFKKRRQCSYKPGSVVCHFSQSGRCPIIYLIIRSP